MIETLKLRLVDAKKKKKEKKHWEGVLHMQTQQGNNREGNFLPQNVAFLFSKVV